jgi:phosphoribosylformylglycinamidine cyclo-ligase
MKRKNVIDNSKIQDGDVIIGLSSSGQANYEKEYNSGIGSNGLTSARHDVFANYLAEKYPETYDHEISKDLVYSGSYKLTDEITNLGIDAGKLVLSPTRTYAPVVKEIIESHRSAIHGMIHCSGGAQTKILNFIDNLHVFKNNLFEIPEIFKIIKKESDTNWKEMYQVFNMGHRFEIYTKPNNADDIIKISKKFGIDAKIIGYCYESKKKGLTIKSPYGVFDYS